MFTNAISDDGNVVVGNRFWPTVDGGRWNSMAFQWTLSSGATDLDTPSESNRELQASAINRDGTVIVGWMDPADRMSSDSGADGGTSPGVAFRWTRDTGITRIAPVPGAADYHMMATEVSASGLVVSGLAEPSDGGFFGNRVFRWTADSGSAFVGEPALLANYPAMDSTGSVIAALAITLTESYTFQWTEQAGLERIMASDSDKYSPSAMTANGTVIFARSMYHPPVRWTRLTGVSPLPLPSGMDTGWVSDTNADGTLAFGMVSGSLRGEQAVLWDANGVHFIRDILADAGVNVDPAELGAIWGASADGKVVVGNAIDDTTGDQTHGWIAWLP